MMRYSVLMSVYIGDEAEHFSFAMESLYLQVIKPYEIVLIGDGILSVDVLNIINEYKLKNYSSPIIFRFHHLSKNIGLGNALNIGLALVSTNVVMRMDSDDYSDPNRASYLLNHLNNNVGVVGSWIGEFNNNIDDCKSFIHYDNIVNTKDMYNYTRDPVGHASVMFYKDLVIKAGGYKDCIFFEDTYLWLRMAKNNGVEFRNIPKVLYYARIGNGFYSRRSGLEYAKIESSHLFKFYIEELIGIRSLMRNLILRPFFRLMPKRIVEFVYAYILRSRL